MYTATFIFDTKQFDEDFHRLDAIIAAAARETTGYLGEEAWEDPKSGRISNIYYWESERGLKQLMEHPTHREAKKRYSEWLSGYQVVISQVLRSYGDRAFAHPSAYTTDAANAQRS